MPAREGLASRLKALEDQAAGRDRRQPLIEALVAPGETPATVTDRICYLALRPRTPLWWWGAFCASLLHARDRRRVARLAVHQRHRRLGKRLAGHVGLRHRALCVVDRAASGGTFVSALFFLTQVGVADIDEPDRRMHDGLCGGAGRHLPDHSSGPALVRLLAVPVPEHDGALAAVAQPARVGLLRAVDLRGDQCHLLVRRPDPGPRLGARPGADAVQAGVLRRARAGLSRLVAAMAAFPGDLRGDGGDHGAGRRLDPQLRRARLRRRAVAGLALDPVPAVLRVRRPAFRPGDWC